MFNVKRLFIGLLTFFYKLIDSLNGTSHVSELFKNNVVIGSISTELVDGNIVNFFCRKRQYLVKHENNRFRVKIHTVFDVYSTVTDNAPEKLKLACSIKVTFPPLIPLIMSDELHTKTLVNAYLDIVKHRLLNNDFSNIEGI